MLHDLFTIAVDGRRQGGWILLLPTVHMKQQNYTIFYKTTCWVFATLPAKHLPQKLWNYRHIS